MLFLLKESGNSIADSCFKEVTTKNGTRMVLSVSKTFMKLKDLILEKKTLEDQVEKMKFVNEVLSSKVNTHEAKLWNITDELNKTWNYVSTLKLQHQKLHTNEQILKFDISYLVLSCFFFTLTGSDRILYCFRSTSIFASIMITPHLQTGRR